MKISFLCFIVFIVSGCYAHKKSTLKNFPSFVSRPNLHFQLSKRPITNKQYAYFLNNYVDTCAWIRGNKDSLAYFINLNTKSNRLNLNKNNIFKPQKGFKNIPIQNVNFWGSIIYCDWLTTYSNKKRENKEKPEAPRFRIPEYYEATFSDTLKLEEQKLNLWCNDVYYSSIEKHTPIDWTRGSTTKIILRNDTIVVIEENGSSKKNSVFGVHGDTTSRNIGFRIVQTKLR